MRKLGSRVSGRGLAPGARCDPSLSPRVRADLCFKPSTVQQMIQGRAGDTVQLPQVPCHKRGRRKGLGAAAAPRTGIEVAQGEGAESGTFVPRLALASTRAHSTTDAVAAACEHGGLRPWGWRTVLRAGGSGIQRRPAFPGERCVVSCGCRGRAHPTGFCLRWGGPYYSYPPGETSAGVCRGLEHVEPGCRDRSVVVGGGASSGRAAVLRAAVCFASPIPSAVSLLPSLLSSPLSPFSSPGGTSRRCPGEGDLHLGMTPQNDPRNQTEVMRSRSFHSLCNLPFTRAT